MDIYYLDTEKARESEFKYLDTIRSNTLLERNMGWAWDGGCLQTHYFPLSVTDITYCVLNYFFYFFLLLLMCVLIFFSSFYSLFYMVKCILHYKRMLYVWYPSNE